MLNIFDSAAIVVVVTVGALLALSGARPGGFAHNKPVSESTVCLDSFLFARAANGGLVQVTNDERAVACNKTPE